MDDWVWAWRLAVITALALMAWLMKTTFSTLKERVDKIDREFVEHVAEDRHRFDQILHELGELKGGINILIGKIK